MLSLILVFFIPSQEGFLLPAWENGLQTEIIATRIPHTDIQGQQAVLSMEAAPDWLDMVSAAARDGVLIEVTYAYRNHDLQTKLKRTNRRLAAVPGFSPHERGVAVDIRNTKRHKKYTSVYHWLVRNAHKYNFHNTIRNECWHWEWKTPSVLYTGK